MNRSVPLPRRRHAVLALVLVSLAACSGGSGGSSAPPPVFTGISATPFGTSRVDLSWSANGLTAQSFNVYRSDTAGTAGLLIANLPPTTTTLRDSGLAASTTYFYTVDSVVAGGAPVRSRQASAATAAVPVFPQDVTGFSVTRVGTTVTLSWDPYPGATSFDIYRSGIQGLEVGTPGTITGLYGSFRTSTVDTEIAGAGHYTYEVLVMNAAYQTATARAEIDVPAGALPGVAKPIMDVWSSSKDTTAVHLFWWGSPGATAQHVYAGPTSSSVTPLQTGYAGSPLDGASYALPIQTLSPMYYQMDVPIDVLSTGDWCFAVESQLGSARADSAAVCVTIYGPPPAAQVTGVKATVSNPTTVTVSWNPVAGASGYYVYRLGSPTEVISDATYVGGSTAPVTTWVDSAAVPGTTSYYRIVGWVSAVATAPSDYAIAKTFDASAPVAYPPVPLGLGQALLSWGGHDSGTTFRIYGGGAIVPSAIDAGHLVLATTIDPTTGTSAWQHVVSAPSDAYAAFLLSLGLTPVWGEYWISEVYPDGTESARTAFLPFLYL